MVLGCPYIRNLTTTVEHINKKGASGLSHLQAMKRQLYEWQHNTKSDCPLKVLMMDVPPPPYSAV